MALLVRQLPVDRNVWVYFQLMSCFSKTDSSQPPSHECSTSNLREMKEKLMAIVEKNTTHNKDENKPLLTKSAILKILAELVKTYGGVAQLITEYTYTAQVELGEKQVTQRWSKWLF